MGKSRGDHQKQYVGGDYLLTRFFSVKFKPAPEGNPARSGGSWAGLFCLAVFLFLAFAVPEAMAAITIPDVSVYSDSALQISTDTQIDLSEAEDGIWSADNSANAGKGIYDGDKWAVVFKYTSVTVDSGVTLSFSNHPKRAPVVWLVSGDVTINGTLSLNGQSYQASPTLAESGPGGFRGGMGTYQDEDGTYSASATGAAGLGPGGGGRISYRGYAGSYGTQGGGGPETYGNPALVPLIGGSGGGGDPERPYGGGGGGGAILIICQGTLTVNGIIQADGGTGRNYSSSETGGGSGGGIRLVATTLAGTGIVEAIGGGGYQTGGDGRIRIERVNNSNTLAVTPDASLLALEDNTAPVIWPPSTAPTVKIISFTYGPEGEEQTVESPDDPYASFGTNGADVVLDEVSTASVLIETTNVEWESTVKVRVTPKFNATYTEVEVDAEDKVQVGEDPLTIRWTAELPVSTGYAAVQVKVIRP